MSATRQLITPEIKTCGLVHQLQTDGRPLPGFVTMPPTSGPSDITDDELLAMIDHRSVAALIHVWRPDDLLKMPARAALLRAARTVGLAPPRKDAPVLADLAADLADPQSVVFASLRNDERARESARLTRALGDVTNLMCLPPETALPALFDDAVWERVLAELAHRVRHVTGADIFDLLPRVAARAAALIEGRRLTRAFPVALKEAMMAKACSLERLAELTGVQAGTIRKWLQGAHPRKDFIPAVRRLEKALDLSPGVLVELVNAPRTRVCGGEVLTQDVRDWLEQANIPLSILPDDWEQRSQAEQREILAWLSDNIAFASPYRRYMRTLSDDAYAIRYEPPPPRLAADFEKARIFKTVESDDPFAAPREIIERNAGKNVRHGGRWRDATTAPLVENLIVRSVSTLRARGVDVEDLGAGFLCHADCQWKIAQDIARRRFEVLEAAEAFRDLPFDKPTEGMIFVEGDVNRLEIFLGLFSPKTGIFAHEPPHVSVLTDGNGTALIDHAWVARARESWASVIADERIKLKKVIAHIAARVKAVRDPWFGIAPILDHEAPMKVLYDGLARMAADRPSFYGSPTYAARHDRDFLAISLMVELRLRRANYGSLTYEQDENGKDVGSLRWVPRISGSGLGVWQVVVPQHFLKNDGSSALPRDDAPLEIELDPRNRSLYDAIDRWLKGDGCSRRVLHGDDCGAWLFPGQQGRALGPSMFAKICYGFSARYIMATPWTDFGLDGVIPFGPHAIRDIVATHLIKHVGIEAAAEALFDTVETLQKRYARLTSVEKSRRTNDRIWRTI